MPAKPNTPRASFSEIDNEPLIWLKSGKKKFNKLQNSGPQAITHSAHVIIQLIQSIHTNHGEYFPKPIKLPKQLDPSLILDEAVVENFFPRTKISKSKEIRTVQYKEYENLTSKEVLLDLTKSLKLQKYNPVLFHIKSKTNKKMIYYIAGFALPHEPGLQITLFDPQNFLPEETLEIGQFDNFYTIQDVYVFTSAETANSCQTFIGKCGSEISNIPTPHPNLNSSLQHYLILEIQRLALIQNFDSTREQTADIKINQFFQILENLKNNFLLTDIKNKFLEAFLVAIEESLFEPIPIPESIEHFKTCFSDKIKHQKMVDVMSPATIKEYIEWFLIREIIRIKLNNKNDSSIKISKYFDQLNDLLNKNDVNRINLKDLLKEIKAICSVHRGSQIWSISSTESSKMYSKYLQPLEEYSSSPVLIVYESDYDLKMS